MSGLKMTREQVEDTHNKAGNHLLNTPDDVGAQEYFCYSTDWLAMYDLLKEKLNIAKITFTSGVNAGSAEFDTKNDIERCPLCGISLNEEGVCPKCGYKKQ